MKRVAVIDVGSNSIKYFLGALNADGTLKTITDQNDIVRLGEGLRETGMLSDTAMARNAQAITRFANDARANGADKILCVGTMALRNAKNTTEFITRVQADANVTLTVIPGEEEARLSYLAVLSALSTVGEVVVFDTGGGSTEFIFGNGADITQRFSIDLGAVRITEKYFSDDPVAPGSVDNALNEILANLEKGGVIGNPKQLVGIGGAVTSMGAVMHQMTTYDPDVIQGSVLTRDEIDRQVADYSTKTLDARKTIPGLQPKRAEVILAGACILKAICTRLGALSIIISDRGLRHGLAYEQLKEEI